MNTAASALARSMKMTRCACTPGRPGDGFDGVTDRATLLHRRVVCGLEEDGLDPHRTDARFLGHGCPTLVGTELVPALFGGLTAGEPQHIDHRGLVERRLDGFAKPDGLHVVALEEPQGVVLESLVEQI